MYDTSYPTGYTPQPPNNPEHVKDMLKVYEILNQLNDRITALEHSMITQQIPPNPPSEEP